MYSKLYDINDEPYFVYEFYTERIYSCYDCLKPARNLNNMFRVETLFGMRDVCRTCYSLRQTVLEEPY